MVFPHNWVKVPGNSTLGTSDFWVMKYEAKYDKDGNGDGDDALTCRQNASYDTWYYGGAGTDCPSSWDNTKVVSTANGSPLAYISHDQAKTACTALGAHLMTNEEWQTIARNAENVDSNWTGSSVGTGYLFNGNSADVSRGYNGADPEKGVNRNSRAKYTLSNGQEIYDISGNVYEHTMRTISDIQTTITTPSCSSGTGWQYCNFGTTESPYITGYGSLTQNDLSPQHSSYSALNQGVGRVYTNSGATGGTVLVRGGSWSIGSYAGAFAASLYESAGNQHYDVGFRCAR